MKLPTGAVWAILNDETLQETVEKLEAAVRHDVISHREAFESLAKNLRDRNMIEEVAP